MEREITEPNILRMERTEEERQRRHNEGDKGAKFSAAKELKPRRDGISNTLTSSVSDNLLLEKDGRQKVLEQVKKMCENKRGGRGGATLEADGTIRGNYNVGTHDSSISEMIVQCEDNPALTLTTSHEPKCYGESTGWRIRKLTLRECFRLMGVDDADIDKLLMPTEQIGVLVNRKPKRTGVPKTQQYKLAGNSIVVDVLFHIFRKMFVEQKNESRQLELF